MTGRSSRIALGILAVLALGARPAAWSWALPQPAVEQEFAKSTAVFVGRVIATAEVRTGKESEASTDTTFASSARGKGISASIVEVATCGGGNEISTVAVEFGGGERYLVFAGGEPLFTFRCGWTGTAKHVLWDQTWEWLSQRPNRLLE